MYEDRTPEQVKAEILADMAALEGAPSTEEGTYFDAVAAGVAAHHWKILQGLNQVLALAFVDETCGGYIDLRCAEYGITRKPGTKARAAVAFTGTAGAVLPAGLGFLSADALEFDLLEAVTLGADGTGAGTVEAVEPGAVYNVPAGGLVRLYSNPVGLERWENAAAEGGTDPESDAALFARLDQRRKRPGTSGNRYSYEGWALESEGIGACKVIAEWDGPGTVKVLVAGPEWESVPAGQVEACAAHIEEERTIGAEVTVLSAAELAVDVSARVELTAEVTLDQVRGELAQKLDAYLKEAARRYFSRPELEPYTLLYNQVGYLLFGTGGVANYAGLTLNGAAADLAVGPEQVPALGSLALEVISA